MIPIKDSIPSKTTPYVNIFLILTNFALFFYEVSLDRWELTRFLYIYGLVPERFFYLSGEGAPFLTLYFPFFTSIFMHAGWFHILGNMLFLWIFGDNVEDEMGHFKYLIFYILCGLGAGFVHLFLNSTSSVPAVGASGAISGVMGAYMLLFPHSRIVTLFPIFFFFTFVEVSAFFFIAIWFIFQLFSGAFSLLAGRAATGGVAWWAHVGGFLVGMGLVFLFAKRPRYKRRSYDW
ncbi:rhomboid family intramembrane serine protease [Candidatus Aerophobetes bacterium]|nr:rhomboid family intramembrane serine protease [Candidatus Aerophobetes bacterium]